MWAQGLLWALGGEKLQGPGPAWAHSASTLRVDEKDFGAVEVPHGKYFFSKSASLNLFSNLPLVHY